MKVPEIHPELQFILDEVPAREILSNETLLQFRESGIKPDVTSHFPQAMPPLCHRIVGPAGSLDVYEFQPSGQPSTNTALLWMHGGGYVTGHGNDEWFGALFAEMAGVRVFSVDYRLAPEHPFPAALEDAWAALIWLTEQQSTLGLDSTRIAIGGASAGAGLAAGLALHNRDQQGPAVAFQLLLYPMLDNEHDNPAGYMDVPRWPRTTSLKAWEMYLGEGEVCASSVPSSATSLAGLPPAYLCIGEADLFLDDVRHYAARLKEAEVNQELQTYAGVFHSAEMLGYATSIGRKMSDDYVEALVKALPL